MGMKEECSVQIENKDSDLIKMKIDFTESYDDRDLKIAENTLKYDLKEKNN